MQTPVDGKVDLFGVVSNHTLSASPTYLHLDSGYEGPVFSQVYFVNGSHGLYISYYATTIGILSSFRRWILICAVIAYRTHDHLLFPQAPEIVLGVP